MSPPRRLHVSNGPSLALPALVLALTTSCVSIRSVFRDMSFPEHPRPEEPLLSDAQAREVRLYATLAPLLASGYASPARAGVCLDAIFACSTSVLALHRFGACLAQVVPAGTSEDTLWTRCMATEYPFLACGACAEVCETDTRLSAACEDRWPAECHALAPSDRIAVHTTLGSVGEALAAFERDDRGPQPRSDPTRDREEVERVRHVVLGALSLLRCDPGRGGAWCRAGASDDEGAPEPPRPAIALSGGAANGAFLAGYVYELLSAREAAVARGDRGAAEARITAVAGTSVGALLAPMVDLYFADEQRAPERSLAWCEASTAIAGYRPPRDCSAQEVGSIGAADCDPVPPPGPRSNQRCALRMLRKYLTDVHTQDLLCIHDGDFHQPFGPGQYLQGPHTSLGAFEPLEEHVLRPFMDQFAPLLLGNDVVHVVMTADLTSDVALGLDERACRGVRSPAVCLTENVLASIPQPMLARAPAHVTMGLADIDALATNGHWLDGGLRSGSPALRATLLTRITGSPALRGRVLALSTELSEGARTPSGVPRGGLENAVRSVGATVNQGHKWEAAYATLYQRERARRAEAVDCLRRTRPRAPESPGAPPAAERPSPEPRSTPGPRAPGAYPSALAGYIVFLPSTISPKLIASGYQFDPLWMRGLFLHGQILAVAQILDASRSVLDYLGWRFHEGARGPFSQRTGARLRVLRRRLIDWEAEARAADGPAHVRAMREDVEKMPTCKRAEPR